MKINYKSLQAFSGHSSISKKYDKLPLSSRPQPSFQSQQKSLPKPKAAAVMTAREMNSLAHLDPQVPHNRQISGQSQPVVNNAKIAAFSPSSKTPKARISSQRRDEEFLENGTVVYHDEMDSLHSKDIRNLTEAMVTQEMRNELSSIEQNDPPQPRQKLPQQDFPTDTLSKSVNLDLNQNQDSFIDQNLLASMRDIAQSVSKVADMEMNNYFKTLMLEQRNMEQLNSSVSYESPVKTKIHTSTSPSRARGLQTLKRTGPAKKINFNPSQPDLNRSFTAETKKHFGEVRNTRSKSPLLGSKSNRDFASTGHHFLSGAYYEEPVYQRLYDTQTLYNQRLEGKKLLRYREQTAEMREKPLISKKAMKMSESQKLKPIYHEKRINVVLSQKEQRLEKLKDEVARKKIQEEGELERMMRRFNVHGTEQTKAIPQRKWEEKVDLLVKVYNERKKKKEEKRVQNDLDFSYKPQLCSKSKKIIQKSTREGAIEDRLLKAQENKDKKLQKIKDKIQPNFAPTLNQNSLKIIDDKVKGFMSTQQTLRQEFRQGELMDSRKEQFKAKERILEGSPGMRLNIALQHQRILEMSPSEQQSEMEKKELVAEAKQDVSKETVSPELQSRPSSVHSSMGIIKKFQDLLN